MIDVNTRCYLAISIYIESLKYGWIGWVIPETDYASLKVGIGFEFRSRSSSPRVSDISDSSNQIKTLCSSDQPCIGTIEVDGITWP